MSPTYCTEPIPQREASPSEVTEHIPNQQLMRHSMAKHVLYLLKPGGGMFAKWTSEYMRFCLSERHPIKAQFHTGNI